MSGVIVSKAGGAAGAGGATEAAQDVQSGHLEDIVTNTGDLSGVIVVEGGTPAVSQPMFPFSLKRDDALSTLAIAEGLWVPPHANARGALWTASDTVLDPTNDGVEIRLSSSKTEVALKYLRFTTAQTGVDLWDPGAGLKIAVKWLNITWSGANACRLTIWQGANADTTYTEGTDRVLFDHTIPANEGSGYTFAWPESLPWKTTVDDEELHVTTSADKVVTITAGGYEFD